MHSRSASPDLRAWTRILPAIACVSLSAACSRQPAETPATPPGPDVWAVVGDSQIRKDDVEKAFRRVTPLDPKPSEEEALAAKLRILDELIDQEVLLQRARSLKVDVPAADVDKAFNERKSNMPDDAFQKELSQRGLTADDMRHALANELRVRKVLEQEVGAKAAVNEAAIRDFYEKNRAQFNLPEARYRIAQIVITPVREPQIRNRTNHDATTPADAQRKAQMVMERIKSGADFAAVAMDYSEDPQSAPQGGDLGFVPASALNQVSPDLRRAVLETKPGQVSVVSAGGAHIIFMLVAQEPAGQRDLNTPGVKEGISDLMRDRREQLLTAAYISAARSDVKIVNTLARQIVAGGGTMPAGLVPAAPGR